MSQDPQQTSPLFTQIDITAGSHGQALGPREHPHVEQTELLHQILGAIDRNNELLEEVVAHLGAAQRQKINELKQWRKSNPKLADKCRDAAESLAQIQTGFLDQLATEVEDSADHMLDGEFVFNEFVDRYGPRLAHLNGVLQMLSQLSNGEASTGSDDD